MRSPSLPNLSSSAHQSPPSALKSSALPTSFWNTISSPRRSTKNFFQTSISSLTSQRAKETSIALRSHVLSLTSTLSSTAPRELTLHQCTTPCVLSLKATPPTTAPITEPPESTSLPINSQPSKSSSGSFQPSQSPSFSLFMLYVPSPPARIPFSLRPLRQLRTRSKKKLNNNKHI